MPLSEAELRRLSRQLLVPGLGPSAQEFLRAARVHVVGAGAIAGPAMLFLAGAGVGTLLVDDGADVAEGDAAAWLYAQDQVGQPRALAAIEALRRAGGLLKARPFSSGAEPTAALVCPGGSAATREAAERVRKAGLPHVVAEGDGDGGAVVTVPVGAPCYACSYRVGSGLPVTPAAGAVLGALAATELVLALAGGVPPEGGRRIDILRGLPTVRPTARQAGCACARNG